MRTIAPENIIRFAGWFALALGIVTGGLLLSPRSADSVAKTERNINSVRLESRLLTSTRNIEDLRVGDRVIARNPEVSQVERASFVEPDWKQWIKLTLAMPKEDGRTLHIEMLRPEEWLVEQVSFLCEPKQKSEMEIFEAGIEDWLKEQDTLYDCQRDNVGTGNESGSWLPLAPVRTSIREIALARYRIENSGNELVGLMVDLDLPEMGASGPAVVTGIDYSVSVQNSPGNVVTSTFRHPPSNQVLDVVFEGETQPVGVTDNHLFWSVSEKEFVPVGQMKVGEYVQTWQGETKRIETKLARPGPKEVFNLEVWGEHVYFVGEQGLLAHNNYITFYHGTTSEGAQSIRANGLSLSKQRPDLDFGPRGFYTTTDRGQAAQWAGENGVVLAFRVKKSDLGDVRMTQFMDDSSGWQNFVTKNRLGQGHEFPNVDVVNGPVLANPQEITSIANADLARSINGFDQQAWLSQDAIKLLKLID